MVWYVLKLLVLLPLIGLLAWGSLKFAQKMQARVAGAPGSKSVRIIETVMLSPTQRLAVIEFRGMEIVVEDLVLAARRVSIVLRHRHERI